MADDQEVSGGESAPVAVEAPSAAPPMGMMDIPLAPDGREAEPVTAAEAVATEPIADDTHGEEITPNTVVDDKPVEPVPAEAVVTAPVVDAHVVPSEPTAEPTAIIALAQAAGIDETDPAKIHEALAAREVAAIETAKQERLAEADKNAKNSAAQKIANILHPAIVSAIHDQDTEGVFQYVDFNTPRWENDPSTPREAVQAYLAIRSEFYKNPDNEALFNTLYNSEKSAFVEAEARIDALAVKYPQHARDVVDGLRKFGATPDFLENIAAKTDQTVKQHTATLNSAMLQKEARIAELETQVSGHAQAIAAARAEGERKALETLRAGKDLANTIGVGSAVQGAGTQSNNNHVRGKFPDAPIPMIGRS